MYKNLKTILSVALISLTIVSCSKEEKEELIETEQKVVVKFDSHFADEDFALNKTFISNNKTYNFKQLRYWVSNLSLIKEDGTKFSIPESYYLMGENTELEIKNSAKVNVYPAKKREEIKLNDIPSGKYKGIEFSVGVAQKYNDNLSLQIGELTQGNGMCQFSWMWATSYIFTRLEGSVESAGELKEFTADTGGNDSYQTVNIESNFDVNKDKENVITINLDVEKLLSGVDVFMNNTLEPNTPEMETLSNNYENAFSKK